MRRIVISTRQDIPQIRDPATKRGAPSTARRRRAFTRTAGFGRFAFRRSEPAFVEKRLSPGGKSRLR